MFLSLVALPFIIDPYSGFINTSLRLDRELQEVYVLTVEVGNKVKNAAVLFFVFAFQTKGWFYMNEGTSVGKYTCFGKKVNV